MAPVRVSPLFQIRRANAMPLIVAEFGVAAGFHTAGSEPSSCRPAEALITILVCRTQLIWVIPCGSDRLFRATTACCLWCKVPLGRASASLSSQQSSRTSQLAMWTQLRAGSGSKRMTTSGLSFMFRFRTSTIRSFAVRSGVARPPSSEVAPPSRLGTVGRAARCRRWTPQ